MPVLFARRRSHRNEDHIRTRHWILDIRGERQTPFSHAFGDEGVEAGFVNGNRAPAQRCDPLSRTYIASQAGRHFDPTVVEVFLQIITDKDAPQARAAGA